ncbi:MAG: PH domain-containing protein [Gammaproteobacteria bacterium]|nr:PH domain-containing protein [Gammaproteobacteria bacterium]
MINILSLKFNYQVPLFNNPEVEIKNIARVGDVQWRKVSARLVTRNTLRNGFTWAIFVLLFIGLMIPGWIPADVLFLNPFGIVLLSLASAFIVVCVIWPIFEVSQRGFVVREHDFLYKQGILFTRTFAIPFARIQHAETTVSIFDRVVNLGALKLYTAGAQSVFLGFEKDYAHSLRTHILDRVRDLDRELVDEEETTTIEGNEHRSQAFNKA